MLLEQLIAALPESHKHFIPELAGAPGHVVHNLGLRHTPDTPPGGLDPQAPVYLLAVDKEPLVEKSHLFNSLTPHHQCSPQRVINGKGLASLVKATGVTAVQARVRQTVVDGEEIEEDLKQGRESEGRVLEAAVAVKQPGPTSPRPWVLVHEVDQCGQGLPAHNGIGVEQHRVFRSWGGRDISCPIPYSP